MSIKYDLDTSTFLRNTPPTPIEGIVYYDDTKRNLQIRNNIEWHALMSGSSSHKMWVYRNDAEIGWVIDSSVSDRVISIKGGVNDYNINGGLAGGNWTGLDHSHTGPSHMHTQPNHRHTGPSHSHSSAAHKHLTAAGLQGNTIHLKNSPPGSSSSQTVSSTFKNPDGTATTAVNYAYTDNTTPGNTGAGGTGNTGYSGTASTGAGGTGNTSTRIQRNWRPAAAVGTLQNLDV